jgi:Mrp family chromosome partitioning ATPase
MNIIPEQYQEIESICESLNRHNARCVVFDSFHSRSGTSSLAISVARRLGNQKERVLLIDLNAYNPIKSSKQITIPDDLANWCFSDVTCQLNTQQVENFHFLSISTIDDLNKVREKEIFEMAIKMLKQEFDYILFDTSPLLQKNSANFPHHLLSSVSDLVVLNVALGKTSQDELDNTIINLKKSGCKNIEYIVTQMYMPPLGLRLIESVNKRLKHFPKIKQKLIRFIKKRTWLFDGV